MKPTTSRGALLVAGVAAAQLLLVGVSVAPQLSARATGETYLVQVEPVDPIDPFRGAYVALDHPSLSDPRWGEDEYGDGTGPAGDVYVGIAEKDGLWVGTEWSRQRPDQGPYLKCHRSDAWSTDLDCGLESFFVDQERATELEDLMLEVQEAAWAHDEWEAEVDLMKLDAEENGTPVGVLPAEPPPADVTIVAEVKVDFRGNAAITDVRER